MILMLSIILQRNNSKLKFRRLEILPEKKITASE